MTEKDQFDRAHKIIEELMPEKGNTFCYSNIIKKCSANIIKTKNISYLDDIIKSESKIFFDYGNLIKEAAELGDVDFVVKIATELTNRSNHYNENYKRSTVSKLLETSQPNRFEMAEKFADTFRDRRERLESYEAIRKALPSSHGKEQTAALDAKIAGIKEYLNSRSIFLDVCNLCKNKAYEDAERLADPILDPIKKLQAKKCLYDAYVNEGWPIFGNPYQPQIDKLKKEIVFTEAIEEAQQQKIYIRDEIETLRQFAADLNNFEAAASFEKIMADRKPEPNNSFNGFNFNDFFSGFNSEQGGSTVQKPVQDHYKTLGVPCKASQGDIKAAYRKLSMQYHPDKNPGDAKAAEKSVEINIAGEILRNADKRRKYDLTHRC